MIKVAIVEDEQEQAERIHAFLERFSLEHGKRMRVKTFLDGDEFVREKDLYKRIRNKIDTPKKCEELVTNLLELLHFK